MIGVAPLPWTVRCWRSRGPQPVRAGCVSLSPPSGPVPGVREHAAMQQAPWIDRELSARLPVLRSEGEGQALEYMRAFPDNAHELAKEVAAFATSNAGAILLGINDDGALV